jgi:PPOX class probable F420-dependent enzyme
MTAQIPDSHKDLFERPIFATIATLMPDGSPHLTPIWIDLDDGHLKFTVIKGHVKDRNIANNPQVAITLFDPDNPYRYIMIRGKVIKITENGANDHSQEMAKKYLGPDGEYIFKDGEVPHLFTVLPEKVNILG